MDILHKPNIYIIVDEEPEGLRIHGYTDNLDKINDIINNLAYAYRKDPDEFTYESIDKIG